MKLFLDTAHIPSIKKWLETGLISGITTNPTHMSKEGNNPTQIIKEICALLPDGEISVEVTEQDPKKVYMQARAIADLNSNVVVKIPCHAQYYTVIRTLSDEGIKLNITLVFSVIQGLMMAKLGVRYISPFIGRWDDIDVDGSQILQEMRFMIDRYHFSTQILAASLRHVRHVHEAILAGADVATMPLDVFEKAITHPLTDRGIALFDADWKKLDVQTFP